MVAPRDRWKWSQSLETCGNEAGPQEPWEGPGTSVGGQRPRLEKAVGSRSVPRRLPDDLPAPQLTTATDAFLLQTLTQEVLPWGGDGRAPY